MHRFFLENLNTSNYSFLLEDKSIVNQLTKVLRAKIGDKIILFDSKDLYDYIFEIKDIFKKSISLEQIDRIEKKSEAKFEINLFQALPNKLDKIESIIKNGTQIGVTNFLFFNATRSQKLNVSEKRIERLNKIILESVEQSGRNIIPSLVVGDKINFQNLKGYNIFLDTNFENSKSLKELSLNNNKIINLFVGPEGGFSESESKDFLNFGFDKVFLGDNILRTELAGITTSFYIIQAFS